jgi:hypothetical protein
LRIQSLADYTIDTLESSFQKRQVFLPKILSGLGVASLPHGHQAAFRPYVVVNGCDATCVAPDPGTMINDLYHRLSQVEGKVGGGRYFSSALFLNSSNVSIPILQNAEHGSLAGLFIPFQNR